MTKPWGIAVVLCSFIPLLAGCFPPPGSLPTPTAFVPDPNAPAASCGMPCDPNLNLNCPAGMQCLSGVCLNEIVCNNCGKPCSTNADCPSGSWYCDNAVGGPADQKYCWSNEGVLHACAQLTEDYCGYSCESVDWSLGGYTCFNDVLVSMDKDLCSSCGKNCTTDADCAPGVECTQFPDENGGGTTGFCWDQLRCMVLEVNPDISIEGVYPGEDNIITPPPDAGPPIEVQPPVGPPSVCDADGICEAGENKDICGDADCPCIDDGVCGVGETAQCRDCITPEPERNSGGGDESGGGRCECAVVCLQEDDAGNCVDRGYRDCNGKLCTP